MRVAFLTAGGLAPCLSASIAYLIQEYAKLNHTVEFFGYKNGYKGLLLGQKISIPNIAEHADVFEHRYGTRHKTLKDLKERGQVPLLDIDYQGAEQIRSRYRDEVVTILIVPPSIEKLEKRLKDRKTDSEKQIAIRLAKAKAELSHWRLFKYIVVNDSLETATAQLVAIYQAEQAQTHRNQSLLEKLTQGGH